MPYLQKCCYCVPLKTGGVILGWIGAASSLLALVHSIIELNDVDAKVIKTMKDNDITDLDPDSIRYYLQISLGVYIAMSLVALLSSSLMITGIVRRNRYLLLPWLVSGVISLVVGLINAMIRVSLAMSISVGAGVLLIFIIVIIFVLYVHIWLAVMSLFQELRKEENSRVGAEPLICNNPPDKDDLPAYSDLV